MPARGKGSPEAEAFGARLAGRHGPEFWRGLEELADTPEFRRWVEAEFPTEAPRLLDPVGRRQFLKLMGASLALAGLGACTRQPTERIYPFSKAPEYRVPGRPLYFATAMPLAGYGLGLLAESHMGRPTKVEGNPEHPASLGKTDLFAQASVLDLYDPDRSRALRYADLVRPWAAFVAAMRTAAEVERARRGAGLRLLTGRVTSPTLAKQIEELLVRFPAAKWVQYEPVVPDAARLGARLAFGEDVDARYRFDRAAVILSLDADFLCSGPGAVRYTSDFTARRRPAPPGGRRAQNRLYVVESTYTNTGGAADHRLAVPAAAVSAVTAAVARALGVTVDERPDFPAARRWVEAVAADLRAHRGRCVVVPGEGQPAFVHAAAHALNAVLGNIGRTVEYTRPVEARPDLHLDGLRALAEEMEAGQVRVLVILDANPVYSAPRDLRFPERMRKVRLRVHSGLYDDETARLCHWHVPGAHYLEAWSDLRAYDGTATIVQPLIAPLYAGKTAHEVLQVFLSEPERSGYDTVRGVWKARWGAGDFEAAWRRAVHDGVVPGTAESPRRVALRSDGVAKAPAVPAPPAGTIEVALRPDPTVFDGRFANNAWLQELPKAVTRLTWDNAALVAPAVAERLGVASGDVIDLRAGDRRVEAPVWILPGQPADSITLHLGYGRQRAGHVGTGRGADAYALRTTAAPWIVLDAEARRTGRRVALANTQLHHAMEGRDLVRVVGEGGHEQAEEPGGEETLLPAYSYREYAWGMVIDLAACTGCNACVVACQAENNIPIVGKDQVMVGREMHWIRIDRYFAGAPERPRLYHQPVPCMQCERAPCELVCPVNATVHSSEGLNDMVYNRCVGTRYCANNCPYKVRRFNFFQYADWNTETLKMQRNPDVTVRSRGVMEKCTYCVQRIVAGRIQSEREDRRVRDGEIVTACQQACPADAIVFGDLNDRGSRAARLRAEPRNYALLAELNTQPRTTYLAVVRNPNPALADADGEAV